jgi:hypothetical protein
MSDVSSFEAAVAALDDPSRASSASAALESLRTSASALPLARAVLESTPHAGAQFHAILLLRAVCLRAWTELSADSRAGVRNLLLSFACAGAARAAPVQSMALVTAAVLFKRAWTDDTAARAALPGALAALADADARTRLAKALVEEFAGGAEGSGATALGLSAEWHRATAGAFERDAGGLRVVAGALAGVLVDAAGAAGAVAGDAAQAATAARAADGLVALLGWDWGGRGAGSGMSPRVAPGAAWGPLFADAAGTLAGAAASLLGASRGARASGAALGVSARALLCALAGVEGDVWNGVGGADGGAVAGASLARALAAHCLDASAAAADSLAALNAPLSSGAWGEAYGEAADALSGIALAFRTHGAARIARAAGAAAADALSAAAAFAGRALARAEHVADAAAAARAKDAFAEAIAEGGAVRAALEAADAAASLWVAVAADLDAVVGGGGGGCGGGGAFREGAHAGASAAAAVGLLASITSSASQLYVGLVRARLAIGRAVVALDIDDDNPFDDETAERDHHETVAALGRLDAAGSVALLSSSAQTAAAALAQAPASASCAEELVILAGYAGAFLADDVRGETPVPPPALIHGARASAAAAAALVALPSALVSALATAAAALGGGSSPLLCEKLLAFAARWAATWLLRPTEKGAAVFPVALSQAFGPAGAGDGGGAADAGSYDAPLATAAPTSGGAAAAEALLTAAGTALVRAPHEPAVARAAITLLGTLGSSALAGAAAARTPALATLLSQANEGLNGSGAGLLGALPDDAAASALATLVLFTRFLGASDPAADEVAEEIGGRGDPAGAAEAGHGVAGGRGADARSALVAAVNRASPHPPLSPAAATLLARRAGVWEPLVVGACNSASRALGALHGAAAGALSGAAGVGAAARAARALTLLAALAPVAGTRAGVPDAWALDALLPALEALPFAFAAAAAVPAAAPVGVAALAFFRAFFDVEWSFCGNATRDAARAYAAAAAAFRALARTGGGGGRSAEDAAADALAVLGVVGAIAEREVISFAADGGVGDDGAAPASAALLEGLGVALGRARAAAGVDARVDSALLDVTSLVIAHHPAAAARLDPAVFSALVDALIAGISDAAPASARAALGAVRSLASTTVVARTKGGAFAAALDLSAQLRAAPDLWARLARAVLGAAVGGAGLGGRGMAAELIGPAGDALLALAVADGAAFTAVARELLAALAVRSAALAQRVAGELEVLTTVELLPRGAPAGGPLVRMPLSFDKYVKALWAKQWEGFCERVHAAATVF